MIRVIFFPTFLSDWILVETLAAQGEEAAASLDRFLKSCGCSYRAVDEAFAVLEGGGEWVDVLIAVHLTGRWMEREREGVTERPGDAAFFFRYMYDIQN